MSQAVTDSGQGLAFQSGRRRMYFAAGWILLVVGAVAIIQTVTQILWGDWDAQPFWGEILLWKLILWSAWGLIGLAVILLFDHLRIRMRPFALRAALHLSIAGVAIALHLVVAIAAWVWLFPELTVASGLRKFVWGILIVDVLLYMSVAIIAPRMFIDDLHADSSRVAFVAGESERRVTALEAELANAKLMAFELQLRPHFLFNALNTVGMLISNGEAEKARKVVTALGDMFRHLLQVAVVRFLPFERELEISLRYLEIEQIRFEERLTVKLDVDPKTLALAIPTLILQPIVENAVKHGAARTLEPSVLRIESRLQGDRFVVVVSNVAVEGDSVSGAGVGVSNVRNRLQQIWADNASFVLEQVEGMMVARLCMPAQAVGNT